MVENVSKKRIGFDLDNTIIDYSLSTLEYCNLSQLPKFEKTTELKQFLNEKDPSTVNWNIAQSWLYTEGLTYAQIPNGLISLLKWLRDNSFEISVHSHKTSKTPESSGSKDLREPIKKWFLQSELSKFIDFSRNVNFYETQLMKVLGISKSNINFFVDDLVEIFHHPAFSESIQKILISEIEPGNSNVKHFTNFTEIQEWFEENYV